MPSREVVQKALETIRKSAANYEYFFGRLNSADWLAPLREAGFFQVPPAAVPVGDDAVSFPDWPEMAYLARVASRVPDAVLDVLLKLPATDNVRVHGEMILVALALPPGHAARWAQKESAWVAKQQSLYFLGERLGQLIVHLANASESDTALDLAARVFQTAPDTHPAHMVQDVRTKLSIWEYEDLLRRSTLIPIATLGVGAFDLLQRLLTSALQMTESERGTGQSFFWRPAIEEHEQNFGHHRPMDALVAAVRDAGGYLIDGEILPVSKIVTDLLDRGGILSRIGLHLLAKYGESATDLVAQAIGNRALFDNLEMRHEYNALSEAWFGRMGEDVRQSVLNWINVGPGENLLALWKERLGTDDIGRDVQWWQRDRLYPLRHSLPDGWSVRYAELVAAHGEPEHDFATHRRAWMGPTAPKGAEELRSMTTSELLAFLAEWKPKDDWMEPTEEGLGRRLQEVVEADPVRFACECMQFRSVDPTYVRAVLAGLTAAMRVGKMFEVTPVLSLCSWVLEQPRQIAGRQTDSHRRMDRDPDWGWTRKQIADLLVAGLEERPSRFPLLERQTVWRLLEALSNDPDPNVSYNEHANLDVDSQALNSVRGQSMRGVMEYALWVHRDIEDREGASSPGIGLVPEVVERLDLGLNPQHEPTYAVRAVYGRWLWALAVIDPDWTRSRLDRLFPNAVDCAGLRAATWESYLAATNPHADLYALLRPQYQRAVEHLGDPREIPARAFFVNRDERLTEHLMMLYWQGVTELEAGDGLLESFYRRASPRLRQHAISYAGRCLHRTKPDELPPNSEGRLRDLFERRLDVALKNAESATELRGFSWWFAAQGVDVEWRFAQLKRLLSTRYVILDVEFLVMEELVRHVQQRPLEVLECVDLLLRTGDPASLVIGSRALFETILSQTASSEDQAIRERAVALIHRLGSLGHSEFRQLLRETAR